MGVYVKGMDMPNKKNGAVLIIYPDGKCAFEDGKTYQAVSVPEHGRLIDADALRTRMYHEAFETDSDMQRWESGCWIRYRLFERMEESAPTIIPAEEG